MRMKGQDAAGEDNKVGVSGSHERRVHDRVEFHDIYSVSALVTQAKTN